ncbi:putative carboxyl methyl esterase [Puccinia graminis f. sp. tritici]|uniref:Protein phosphatase methylesterase 1 n=1 Tax=Puccinia graminis f. sp. tritici TaxID=56615 RepID=A0A5B0NXC2_PUCGR|nr:putative carboxyl methyl esterase [Puccinia graminis f. sp. tritici]KAA1129985.1 putative carboxyl methyl esterase [Puccinia graminis f. sp. tritici]
MDTIDQKYAPLSAADCFQEALLVTVGASKLFRVYSNPGKSPVLFVFHHGAGYSALSAACLARELREQGGGQYGFLSFDCRAHGASQVESEDSGPPDLSLSTLANDLVDLLKTIYPDKTIAPAFVLVGHSMGGAVVTEACAGIQTHVGKVLGLVILDVVEGSALSALISMMPLINSRPSSFSSQAECIKYHLDSHTIRNLASARISVPSLIRKASSNTTTTASVPDPGDEASAEGDRFEWITDLRSSQPYWEGWYRGLSSKFLSQKTARLLVLAGTDRLDKELMIGQMQGKYQLSVLPNVGHCVHEDDPEKLASLLIGFAERNDHSSSDEILARLGKKPLQKLPHPSPFPGGGRASHPHHQ